MMDYAKALFAIEVWKRTKVLPPKFNGADNASVVLNDQLHAYGDELQSDVDEAQARLDELAAFEEAWDKAATKGTRG